MAYTSLGTRIHFRTWCWGFGLQLEGVGDIGSHSKVFGKSTTRLAPWGGGPAVAYSTWNHAIELHGHPGGCELLGVYCAGMGMTYSVVVMGI